MADTSAGAEASTAPTTEDFGMHVGRSWTGHRIEDECGCPQHECGLVTPKATCREHGFSHAKTIRQAHPSDHCPGTEA